MRISTFAYCVKQGIVNICRNILFSLASMATISACIFLFCLFFAIAANVRNAALTAQNTLGITVFFDDGLDDESIAALGDQIASWGEVREMIFTSAQEAWESFKEVYFQGDEELAASFEEDNPLAGSASYTIYLNDIESQSRVVSRLNAMDGVRKVNSSDTAAMGLSTAGKIVGILSLVMIAVLLAVAVFLISNTISTAAAFRRRENEIMRLIGATNFMIRAPFVELLQKIHQSRSKCAELLMTRIIKLAIPITHSKHQKPPPTTNLPKNISPYHIRQYDITKSY